MTDPNLIAFVWNAVSSGVIGNVAYDGIKLALGKGFDRLASYAKENKKNEFETALISILETNEKILQELSQLREGVVSIQQQNHYGTGDNIWGNKIINVNQFPASSQAIKYDLTEKQKIALTALVELGRAWRKEFYMVWRDLEGEFSDISSYDGNPPQISRGDIRALKRANLIDCEFIEENRARISLTSKSDKAVETNFQETE